MNTDMGFANRMTGGLRNSVHVVVTAVGCMSAGIPQKQREKHKKLVLGHTLQLSRTVDSRATPPVGHPRKAIPYHRGGAPLSCCQITTSGRWYPKMNTYFTFLGHRLQLFDWGLSAMTAGCQVVCKVADTRTGKTALAGWKRRKHGLGQQASNPEPCIQIA